MRFWPSRRPVTPPEAPREDDLIAYARTHVTSPGAMALLDEVERGRKRREAPDWPTGHPEHATRLNEPGREFCVTCCPMCAEQTGGHAAVRCSRPTCGGRPREQAAEPLHAHEITPDDAAMIRMMAGAHFAPDAVVTLPSGKTITGAEMQRWIISGVTHLDDEET